MGRIPDHVVEEVRQRADIVGIVGRSVTLRRSGSHHKGLCPFHDEKTPSFHVHEDKGIFHCFGCEAAGDVFEFRMRHDGLDFPDAVRSLARELGIEIPVSSDVPSGRTSQLHRCNEIALAFYRDTLRSAQGAVGRSYLRKRGIDDDLAERFQIGFAPEGWDGLCAHLQKQGESLEVAERAGLVAQRQTGNGHYDRFRARIVFPISEPSGHVIGFGGRAVRPEDTPKYLNSPENAIYHKGRVLFGLPLALDAIRARGRIIVVEGYFDLLALHRAGLCEGVAPCGTALTPDHARRLRRYAQEVVLLFDGDDAGRRAAERALPLLLSAGLRVRAAFLPEGEDPDTWRERQGEDALRRIVDEAAPLLDTLMERRLHDARGHAWSVADAARAIAPLLRALDDPIERAAYVRQLAQRLCVPEAAFEKLLRGEVADEPKSQPLRTAAAMDPTTRVLLATLAGYPELLPLLETLDPEWLPDGTDRTLIEEFRRALCEHGEQALAHLLSPTASPTTQPVREQIVRIAADARRLDPRTAEQAVRDCIARLGIRALDRQAHALSSRLESCNDPAELEALLAEKQHQLDRRRELWSQFQHR
ncbi:MAG: DNA primase [Myxococcota bacterium]